MTNQIMAPRRNFTRQLCAILITANSLAGVVQAQETTLTTNAPRTEIELFELQTSTVIVKGIGQMATLNMETGTIFVRVKETADIGTGRKLYGLTIGFAESNQPREKLVVDYDELESLLNGSDYLSKISYDVTPLPSFEAAYTTKSGLRIVAYSSRRQGGIQTFLQFGDNPRIPLASDQVAQFRDMISQARNALTAMMPGK